MSGKKDRDSSKQPTLMSLWAKRSKDNPSTSSTLRQQDVEPVEDQGKDDTERGVSSSGEAASGEHEPLEMIVETPRESAISTPVAEIVEAPQESAASTSREPSVPLDIANYDRSSVDDQTKFNYVTNHWKPETNYTFPKVSRTKKGKTVFLTFQHKWLETHTWLAYSPSEQGAFCKHCRIFAPDQAGGQTLRQFVKTPMRNLRDATALFADHAKKEYHNTAMLRSEDFVRAHASSNVREKMTSARSEQAAINRKVLGSIIDTIKLCGRQNIPLRGHRDSGLLKNPTDFETSENEGNFRALLRFRMSSGDKDLLNYTNAGPLNALYTSWRIQNEIIDLCGEEIGRKLIWDINNAKFFSVLADETSDVARTEQFSICARYVKVDGVLGSLREDFLGFVKAKDTSGQALADLLLENLGQWGINSDGMRGQEYDGAANMSGKFKGVHAIIQKSHPKASYTHCSSHCLNLVISHACSGPSLKKTVRTVQDVINFFTGSPKRTNIVKEAITTFAPSSRHTKLKSLCETRWVERHEAILVFTQLYSAILHSLGEIEESSDTVAADKAEGFKLRMRTREFVCNLKILEAVLGITFPLSVALQLKDVDLISCFTVVNECRASIQALLDNAESEFNKLFNDVQAFFLEHEIPLVVRGLRSADVSEVEKSILESSYRPLLTKAISELEERFGTTFSRAAKCFCILPSHIIRSGTEGVSEDEAIFQLYAEDLDAWSIVKPELLRWERKWKSATNVDIPKNALDAFNSAPADSYPNIRKLLQILATLPVTTASAERSFSQLRTLKTYLRSTVTEERLNGLALMKIHRDIAIPRQTIIENFAAKKARRLKVAV